jgi:dihydrofolate synthase/folylpolyglutamate synthase
VTRADLATVLHDLYARIPKGMRLGLAPMAAACAAFGHPERAARTLVHVAGTNGKGSVSAMVESMARASGLRTGLYTSPHLSRFAERIRIDGDPIDDDALARILGAVLPKTPELSFFESATLAAMLAFRDADVDVTILEVGLGGRLDATNVVPKPDACAITRIAFDHMDRLGPTLEHIAREKAGIAKRGSPIVLGPMAGSVRAAIAEVADPAGAPLVDAHDDAEACARVHDAAIALPGAHQRENAKVAWVLGRLLGIPDEARHRGLETVRWPGRLESIDVGGARYVLDAAHNPDGAEAVATYLRQSGATPERTVLVFGALLDKEWASMLGILANAAAHRVYTNPRTAAKAAAQSSGSAGASQEPRSAVPLERLAALHPGAQVPEPKEALAHAAREFVRLGADRIVVAGSIYLVGHARAHLLGLPEDPPVAL